MPLVVVGLGPGDPADLTTGAREALQAADRVVLRTRVHPALDRLGLAGASSFDHLYETAGSFDELYAAITAELSGAINGPDQVVYAVPGHPLVGEASVRLLVRRHPSIRVIGGLSFLDEVCRALVFDPLEAGWLVCDALEPRLHPDVPVVYAQLYDRAVAGRLKLELLKVYPAEHPVTLVRHGRPPATLALASLDHDDRFDHLTSLVVPAPALELTAGSFDALRYVVQRLRSPDGCPWDREQTNGSITKYLVEETYEAIDALEAGDMTQFAEELGDVLLQVLLHAQIADDEGNFDIHDVMAAITTKLVRRHPHVFGDTTVTGADDVVANWDAIKQQERDPDRSMLASVPRSMPALAQAQDLRDRAARVGFDWPNRQGALDKLREEVDEYLAASPVERRHELGDVLFSLVNLAAWDGIEAEDALRAAAGRFRDRFAWIERRAREAGSPLAQLGLATMDAWWDEAKAHERDGEPSTVH